MSQSNSRLHWSPLITSKPTPLFLLLLSLLNSSHTLSTTTQELTSPTAMAPTRHLPTPHSSTDPQSLALTHSLPTLHPSTPSPDPSHSLHTLHPSTPSLDPSHSLPTLHPSTDPQSLASTRSPTLPHLSTLGPQSFVPYRHIVEARGILHPTILFLALLSDAHTKGICLSNISLCTIHLSVLFPSPC